MQSRLQIEVGINSCLTLVEKLPPLFHQKRASLLLNGIFLTASWRACAVSSPKPTVIRRG